LKTVAYPPLPSLDSAVEARRMTVPAAFFYDYTGNDYGNDYGNISSFLTPVVAGSTSIVAPGLDLNLIHVL
jgi:hypothetical protein